MTETKQLEDFQNQMNDYQDYLMTFSNNFISKLFMDGIIDEVSADDLKKYFSNPDRYQDELHRLAQYYYIANAEVHQMYELIEVLPKLNYGIKYFTQSKSTDNHISVINKALYKVKHKRLTRDLMKQLTSVGNLVGIWLNDKKSYFPYIFDDMEHVYPVGRNRSGDWICKIDMIWFDNMEDDERKNMFGLLSPYVTKTHYENFKKNRTVAKYQYVDLPSERTFVLRTGTLKRNQVIGTNWATPGLTDVLHKKKLKDVERTVANKIINAVAVLTLGSEKHETSQGFAKLKKSGIADSIHQSVRNALEKNNTQGVTVVAIPEFADLEFPDLNVDGLDGDKFTQINSDINSAYGLSGAVLNGEGGNFSSAKINLEIFYKRIGVLLEDIEVEVYGKLFNLILPSNQSDNYYMEYEKEAPISTKEKIDYLFKMNDKGWSTKFVVDSLGLDWNNYLEQTLYETEQLELQSKIKPYLTSYTSTSEDVGNPELNDANTTNENTVKNKTSGSNNLPSQS